MTVKSAASIFFGLLLAYVAGSWLYYGEPWYSRDLIHEIGSGPHSAPWGEASDKAAKFFPAGMERESAMGLLRANGFKCSNPTEVALQQNVDSMVIEVAGGVVAVRGGGPVTLLTCRREAQEGVCMGRYSVSLAFDTDSTVAGRAASYYFGCL